MSDDAAPPSPATPAPAPPPMAARIPDDADPATIIPLEAAREHILHWWREPLAGFAALAIGVYDTWKFGREAGLSSSLDEALVIGGIVLIAGSRRLFGGVPVHLPRPNGGEKQQ